MGVPGRTPGTMFAPIPVSIVSYSPEIVGSKSVFLWVMYALQTVYFYNYVIEKELFHKTEILVVTLTCYFYLRCATYHFLLWFSISISC